MMPVVFDDRGLLHWAKSKQLSGNPEGMNELNMRAFCGANLWIPLTGFWASGHKEGISNCLRCVVAHERLERAFEDARRIGGGVPASLHKSVFGDGTPLWRFE